MADTEDFSTLKERAKKKLERDMGPLLLGALNDLARSKSCSTRTASCGRKGLAKR